MQATKGKAGPLRLCLFLSIYCGSGIEGKSEYLCYLSAVSKISFENWHKKWTNSPFELQKSCTLWIINVSVSLGGACLLNS